MKLILNLKMILKKTFWVLLGALAEFALRGFQL